MKPSLEWIVMKLIGRPRFFRLESTVMESLVPRSPAVRHFGVFDPSRPVVRAIILGAAIVAWTASKSVSAIEWPRTSGAPTAARSAVHSRQPRPKNGHIHLSTAARLATVHHHSIKRRLNHHHVYVGGIYATRVLANHRTARVNGRVVSANGRPVVGAQVHLAGPHGRKFGNHRARHATYTDASGSFSMRSVHPRSYRVVASKKGVGGGHTGARVHAGKANHVTVKLGASAPKKQRRRH